MFDAWKQRQRQRLENRPERTVFYNIFATMMLVLAVELLMAVASILAVNVTEQLDENAKDLLTMRVRNRASYVQEILRNAEDLEQLSEQITATTQQLLKSGDISLDTLDNGSEQSDALLVALAPQLLDTLRTKQVTGIFLILNTHDLDTCEVGKKMPGIYLRDMDPDARPSERNSDLLLERASATVVKELAIGTDKGWQPAFPYQGDTKGGILRTVFQTAYKSDAGLSAESYGRWTTDSYCLAGDDRHAIAYSQPLILPDGTVYGVVGVELLTDYLQTKLPFTELDEDKAGTYFIVTTTDDALTDGVLSLRKTVTSGEDLVTADAPLGVLNCRSDGNGGNWAELNDKRYYMVLEPLQVYNRNAPFAAEKWFLAGTMEQSVLLAFSSRVREVLLTTIAITLVLSVLGSLLVSARLARPINRLYREVIDAQEKKTFPRLSRTAIREVDRFAETITELNKELVTNSTKFLRIMDMASVEIGGYELRTDTGSVFVTDNFFSLLGKPEMQGEPLSVRRFEEVLKGIREKNPCDHTAEGDELLTIQQPDGVRYIMLRSTIEGHAKIGLAEDVTAAVQEILQWLHNNGCGQNDQHGPDAHDPDRQLLDAGDEARPAIAEGAGQLGEVGSLGGGVFLHLVQREVDRGAGHLLAVPVQLRLPALDLVLDVAEGRFDLQQVGEVFGAGLKLLQTCALGRQVGEPGLDVHILGGDILGLLALVGHIARLRHSIQKALVIFFRHTEGQVDAAAGPDV